MRLRNLGGSAWPVGSERLGTAGDARYALERLGWPDRPPALALNANRPGATAVHPGEIGEWRVPLSAAGRAAGSYPLQLQAVTGSGRYGPVVRTTVTVPGTAAPRRPAAPPAVQGVGARDAGPLRLEVVLEQCLAPVPGGTGRYSREVAAALARTAAPGDEVTGLVAWHRDVVGSAACRACAGPRRLPLPRRALVAAWERGRGPAGRGGRAARPDAAVAGPVAVSRRSSWCTTPSRGRTPRR